MITLRKRYLEGDCFWLAILLFETLGGELAEVWAGGSYWHVCVLWKGLAVDIDGFQTPEEMVGKMEALWGFHHPDHRVRPLGVEGVDHLYTKTALKFPDETGIGEQVAERICDLGRLFL